MDFERGTTVSRFNLRNFFATIDAKPERTFSTYQCSLAIVASLKSFKADALKLTDSSVKLTLAG